MNLTVDFGHHEVKEGKSDKTLAEWGASLFNGLFKNNSNKAQFIIQLANEDTYSRAEWSGKLSRILKSLRMAWLNDPVTMAQPFPYSQLAVRRCPPNDVPLRFKIAAGDTYELPVETEYHFPWDQTPNWSHPATIVSNDGQIVYRTGTDPKTWAYDDDEKPLRSVSLADFKSKYGSRALLWHPALHRWSFSKGAYHAAKRADVDGANKTAFLNLLADFLQ
ncbi:MAG: hypothetical protein NT069_31070 [Planctomycetota bacterium]|nr:hypothetical protein [Planctomycetota bacterium]